MVEDEQDEPVVVPHAKLDADALRAVIEEYVTRDGTELSDAADKSARVAEALRRGELVLVFDPASESCTFVAAADLPAAGGD